MDMELLLGQTVINTLGNGEMEKVMEMAPKYGKMERSILVLLKMINYMAAEHYFIQMGNNIPGSL